MKITYSGETFSSNGFFKLKNQDWLNKQRVAGKVVAKTLNLLLDQVNNKTNLTLIELNELAEKFIYNNNCTPTFKNYKGFPAGVCISVNKQLVHGIPTDYKLQDGDVVSFDLGATYEGAIADSAVTCIFGEPKSKEHVKLIQTTEEALVNAINLIKIGNQLGCIGDVIFKHAKRNNFSVVTQYGGHGLDWNEPHASPFVCNKSELNEGIHIQPGLTLAIEPLFVIGNSSKTNISKDGWTVYADNICCHFEHTIFIHENYVEIITDRNM